MFQNFADNSSNEDAETLSQKIPSAMNLDFPEVLTQRF